MTQRVELATVLDRLAVDELVTGYAVAVDDGDWAAYRALFAPGGRADYRAAGGVEGSAEEIAQWLTATMELFPMRQHLIVNRLVRFDSVDRDVGDTARAQADYINPMRFAGEGTAPDFVCGGPLHLRPGPYGRRLAAAPGERPREVAARTRAGRPRRVTLPRPARRPCP